MAFLTVLSAIDTHLQAPPKKAATYSFNLLRSYLPSAEDPNITTRVKHALLRITIGTVAAGTIGYGYRFAVQSLGGHCLLGHRLNLYAYRTAYSGIKAVLEPTEQSMNKAV